MAWDLVDEAIHYVDLLGLDVRTAVEGATVIDAGAATAGGYEAGLLITEIQTAGLATVQLRVARIGDLELPHIEITTDHPAIATLCSQQAAWQVSLEQFEGLACGPARALIADGDIFDRIGYVDAHDRAVVAMETTDEITPGVIEHLADRTGVEPTRLAIVTHPTASLVGSVTAAARSIELAMVRLNARGFDPTTVRSATGLAPIAPVADEEWAAIARTNDALAYGGRVHLIIENEDVPPADHLASTATEAFDEPFATILDDVDWEGRVLPAGIFAPACVTVEAAGAGVDRSGAVNPDQLLESFGYR